MAGPDMLGLDMLGLGRMVDGVLAPWAGAGPGMTIGVVRDGALVVHRSAGMASVEHRVPIGPATRFRIASVSKQFTCAAVLMLAREGRLGVEDDVRTHLPEVPDMGHLVTVAQLMHNTSGIRDMLEVLRQGGADLGAAVPAEGLLAAICRQRTLNFRPGTRFLYSNSNFFLLGLIVERLSGQALPAFLDERIFGPLGMGATAMTPDVHVAVADLATGYFPEPGGGYRRAAHGFALGGEGGLVSSVEDLALWDRNLDTGRVGGDWLAPALAAQAPFLNGAENRYARGQSVRDHRGLRTVSHGGLWPGYRTEFLRVPARGTTVIAIANTGAADPNLAAHRVLDAVLDGMPGTAVAVALPPRATLAAMAGRYVDGEGGATLDVGVADTGEPTFTANGLLVRGEALADGRVAAARSNAVFAVRQAGPEAIELEQDAGVVSVWRRVAAGAALPAGLAGVYRSDEMAASWTLAASGDGMVARAVGPVATGGDWPVEPIEGDLVRVHVPGTLYRAWLDVRVVRAAGSVSGLQVTGGRVKRAWYPRVG